VRVANVTAAIATLNRPDALMRCLDGLLVGEVLPAEVLIVDQSQGDATRQAVEQRGTSPVPIIYIRQEPRGLSASRNAAVARASSPVVAVTDDDCVPDRGWIAAIDRAFTSRAAPDALTGRVLPLGPATPGLHDVSLREGITSAEFSGKVIPWLVGTGGNFAVKREWFDRIGSYDERLGVGSPGRAAEDADLIYRLLRVGARIRYEPDALIYHERQSIARRLASRWSYGHGVGTFCGIWLRRRDLYTVRILAGWLFTQYRELAGAVRRREWLEAQQRLLSLRGTMRGVVHGLRVRQHA
jgi:GT2 family glycosyltransferase